MKKETLKKANILSNEIHKTENCIAQFKSIGPNNNEVTPTLKAKLLKTAKKELKRLNKKLESL